MIIEALKPLHIRKTSGDLHLQPGAPIELPDEEALRLLQKVPNKVRAVPQTCPAVPLPDMPLHPGWYVAYRDPRGRLRGGKEAGPGGMVSTCLWRAGSWQIVLQSGARIPLRCVTSVAKTQDGKIIAAWEVRVHGSSGEGPQPDATKEGGG